MCILMGRVTPFRPPQKSGLDLTDAVSYACTPVCQYVPDGARFTRLPQESGHPVSV